MARNRPPSGPAERLRQARQANGYATATEAALAFGYKRDTYLQHENGTNGIAKEAARYAKNYRVSLDWLLTGKEPSGLPHKASAAKGRVVQQIHVSAELLHSAVSFALRAEDVPPDRAELAADIFVAALSRPPIAALGDDPLLSFQVRYADSLDLESG